MDSIDRRSFIKQSALLSSSLVVYGACNGNMGKPIIAGKALSPDGLLGGLKEIKGPDYLPNAKWYEGNSVGDGFIFTFPKGTLAGDRLITTDMLTDGIHMAKFQIQLQEGENGPIFAFRWGALNQCSLRMRMPLSLVDQNRWGIDREGSFLKPRCSGDRVDLNKVDRMRLVINKKSDQPVRFCLTPIMSTEQEIPLMESPVLPKGKLIDDIGQSTIHQWSGKTKDLGAMKQYLNQRLSDANHSLPDTMSKWGGWKKKRLDQGTGFFQTHHDGKRWWLVDPDGYYFWSAGIDCVRVDTEANCYLLEDALTFVPDEQGDFADIFSDRNGQKHINYLAANYIRTFGKEDWRANWAKISLDELKRLRYNTVGNWSEWEYAKEGAFPYVRPMSFNPTRTRQIYRDFPDVFHADFSTDATEYAEILADTFDDPALIGYFMMNEPKWAFSSELPAVGMLYNTPSCETRTALHDFLKEKYGDETSISQAWDMEVTFAGIGDGKWQGDFTEEAKTDLETFSGIMVDKYFTALSDACRKVAPNHLNLGIRYAGVPPEWAVEGMKSFDVFSMNCYQEKVPIDQTDQIYELLNMPIIIGEWHFGALDVGLPSSGIGHVHTQEDRGKAYRVYMEDAAANPNCIGTHWFTLYDQSALGRFDGENYQIGFLDICNKPHEAICDAAIKSHEAMYDIADGNVEPYDDAPEYLPKLF